MAGNMAGRKLDRFNEHAVPKRVVVYKKLCD
jgi:hypothetical protein